MAEQTESVKVDAQARRISGKGVAAEQIINLRVRAPASASATLAAGETHWVRHSLINIHGLRLFGTPHWDYFEDSVADANMIPEGTAVDYTDWQIDWRLTEQEDDTKKLVLKVFLVNLSAEEKDVVYSGYWRYLRATTVT